MAKRKPHRKSKAKATKPRATKRKPKKAPKPKARPRPRPRRDPFSRTLEGKLVGALEHAQDLAIRAGHQTRLNIRRPIGKAGYDDGAEKTTHGRRNYAGQWTWKSPWTVIGEFTLRHPIGYGELYVLLKSWDSASLARRINKFRIARIRVVYSDKGFTDEYSLSETFAWSFALARSMMECDPLIDKSLAQRYQESVVLKIIVWLSHEIRGMKVVR